MDMGSTQLMFSFLGGAGVASIVAVATAFTVHHKKMVKVKEKELSTKTIGLVISETSSLFSSYRLGELNFPDFERKVREMISKIDEEVSDNLSVLDNCYVTLLSRYAEDKRESLMVLREILTNRNPVQQMQAPVQQMQAPVQQMQAPVQQMQAPVQQMQAPRCRLLFSRCRLLFSRCKLLFSRCRLLYSL